MTDVEYCPRCEMVCIEDEDHHVQCGHCFFSFCSLCREPWHVVEKCATPDELLAILQERQGRAQQGEGQRRKELHLINDILSMRVVNVQSKRCPTCQMAISKTGCCNKMYCTYCLNYFCFVCGVCIYDYLHFGQDKCALLDREEIERWEILTIVTLTNSGSSGRFPWYELEMPFIAQYSLVHGSALHQLPQAGESLLKLVRGGKRRYNPVLAKVSWTRE